RRNIPAVFVSGGTIKPGHYKGQDLTVVSAFEAVGQYSARRLSEADLLEVERRACPGAGACGGMFTANTMSSAIEAMGMSLPYSSTMAAEDGEKGDSAARSAEVLVEAVRHDRRPRTILTRAAFENAIAVVMALGGSTNAVLHLLAIARAAGVPLTLDDFEPLRERGREDHGDQTPEDDRPGARVRLRRRLTRRDPRGPHQAGGHPGDPLRGAEGRTGHAGDALPHLGDHRRRIGRPGGAHHRRA